MQPKRIAVLAIMAAMCLFVCASAFGFLSDKTSQAISLRSTKAAIYLDSPLWQKTDSSLFPAVYYRTYENESWKDWQSLKDQLMDQKRLNPGHWYRDAQRYMVDAVNRSYQGKELDQNMMLSTRGFGQTIRIVNFLDGTQADSAQLKVIFHKPQTESVNSVVVSPYALPKAE